jgi:hypothetical protein
VCVYFTDSLSFLSVWLLSALPAPAAPSQTCQEEIAGTDGWGSQSACCWPAMEGVRREVGQGEMSLRQPWNSAWWEVCCVVPKQGLCGLQLACPQRTETPPAARVPPPHPHP